MILEESNPAFTAVGSSSNPYTRPSRGAHRQRGKAQALGETELQSDPGFQSGLKEATARLGLPLSLDSINHAVNALDASQAGPAKVRARHEASAALLMHQTRTGNRQRYGTVSPCPRSRIFVV